VQNNNPTLYYAQEMGMKLSIRRIHLIGIGGAGMGGIAEVLHNQGFNVTGSDSGDNAMTQRLKKLGITVYHGHDARHVEGAEVVVRSSAVAENNVEVVYAQAHKIPVVMRAQMLAELMRFHHGIAIAGTHGKTTTTSLAASVLAEAGLDPTFVIGGLLNSAGTNARLGKGQFFVVEADESDASFLLLTPILAIVTNIDMDHMETYAGDFQRLQQTFLQFIHHLPFYGAAILCLDDPIIAQLLPQISRRMVTYGIDSEADVRAVNITQQGVQIEFTVLRKGKAPLALRLNLAGRHNVLNALSIVALAEILNIDDASLTRAFAEFQGIGRRFQIYGEYKPKPDVSVLVVDDYGHHPREVAATLAAARAAWPERRLVLTYQPHRYTRTRDLLDDFAEVLSSVDVLLYAAGEEPIVGVNSRALARTIRERGKVEPILVGEIAQLPELLGSVLKQDDVLLTQGAGSIGGVAKMLLSDNSPLMK
jgi:UDP-N-acetylmuramate--alanine ligase